MRRFVNPKPLEEYTRVEGPTPGNVWAERLGGRQVATKCRKRVASPESSVILASDSMRERDLADLLRSTPEPALLVGPQATIRFWNTAAERLFGRSVEGVAEQPCAQIVQGSRPGGALFCTPNCPLLREAAVGRAGSTVEFAIRAVGGVLRTVRCVSLVTQNQAGAPLLVHLLHDIESEIRLRTTVEHFLAQVATIWHPGDGSPGSETQLTGRERLILELLVEGHSTSAIAKQLGITPATVRNHIQHVLHKLSAHTRLQAVLRAVKDHLV